MAGKPNGSRLGAKLLALGVLLLVGCAPGRLPGTTGTDPQGSSQPARALSFAIPREPRFSSMNARAPPAPQHIALL